MVASAPLTTDASAQPQRGSYWITTFGCQMNKADSERMAGILEAMGYREASAELDADLVLYNTYTIRDNAEQKVYSYLGRQARGNAATPISPWWWRAALLSRRASPCSGGCRSWIW